MVSLEENLKHIFLWDWIFKKKYNLKKRMRFLKVASVFLFGQCSKLNILAFIHAVVNSFLSEKGIWQNIAYKYELQKTYTAMQLSIFVKQ